MSLADDWLEKRNPSPHDDTITDALWRRVDGIEATAERFFFSQDLTVCVREAMRRELDVEVMLRHVKIPAHRVWVEFPIRPKNLPNEPHEGRIGVLLVTTDGVAEVYVVYRVRNGIPRLLTNGWVDVEHYAEKAEGLDNDAWCTYNATFIIGDQEKDDLLGAARSVILGTLYGLFLLSHPKTIELVRSVPDEKLQRARAKRGKKPFLSFTNVTIVVGAADKRYEKNTDVESAGESGGKRAYHHVIGYWRTTDRGLPTERVKYVADYWRGDPALGIVLHDRNVVLQRGDS